MSMQVTAQHFETNASRALRDPNLRKAMGIIGGAMASRRVESARELPEFEALRDEGVKIKNHVLAHIDLYLEKFEAQVKARGGHVHWCRTPREARETILALCRSRNARTVTKGKSMVTEEIGLNAFLEEQGIQPVETDLGEYIIQLAHEPPSHIIGPALHKTREQIADLFEQHHPDYELPNRPGEKAGPRSTEPQVLVTEARQVLRDRYFQADVGITGANFLIAETGATVIVTNEGNGDLTQSLPKMHIVVSSIEKVIPNMEDLSTILRILARSATGQEMSVYTTLSCGPKRSTDLDGPEEFHVVLLDNGRSEMLGTTLQPLLRCIRCGACMNNCPVYHSVGGHAYGWVYPGPIGAALDPHMIGLETARHLPNASTFCGKCEEVCPMRIPLPDIMRWWREQAHEKRIGPAWPRWGVEAWAFAARNPWLYRLGSRIAVAALHMMGKKKGGRFAKLPLASGWTDGRDLPAPQSRDTFMAQYKRQKEMRR
ncbi:LutB/LldF family L-lactate oxidation iron-sulfur protein [Ferrovibrio sp.]|uniref:LutB/LldF family L-lactate oxidation iron-sulfur protein n=1 Tax=Ferrovibrio sp. TaxID=1917215 RepID=UPI0039C88956